VDKSILISTKKILGLDPGYTPFDADVITHINSALAILSQLGVGPDGGLYISDATAEWSDLESPEDQTNAVKSYIGLKVRMLFDPPTTSFHIAAMEKQIREFEWRINSLREEEIYTPQQAAEEAV
jgi:hypothetical protein